MSREASERPPASHPAVNDPGARMRPVGSDLLSNAQGSVRKDSRPVTVCPHEEPPCPDRAHDASAPAAEPAPQPVRSPGILVVDDEEGVRALLRAVLRQKGFVVWLAGNGQQALDLYRDSSAEIDVVLLDIHMPLLDGPQTLTALQQFRRAIRCCFMTADSGIYTERELLQRGALHIFRKPFRLPEIARVLWEIAHDWQDGRNPGSGGDTLPDLFLG